MNTQFKKNLKQRTALYNENGNELVTDDQAAEVGTPTVPPETNDTSAMATDMELSRVSGMETKGTGIRANPPETISQGATISRAKRRHVDRPDDPKPENAPKVSAARRGRSLGVYTGPSKTRAQRKKIEKRVLAILEARERSPVEEGHHGVESDKAHMVGSGSRKESKPDGGLNAEEDRAAEFNQVLQARKFRKVVGPTMPVDDPEEMEDKPDNERDPETLSPEELRAFAGGKVASILEVAKKSGHLQGPYVKRLRENANGLMTVVEILTSRTEEEEVRRLRLDNGRLRKELENLRGELKAHRREFSEIRTELSAARAPAPPPYPVLDTEELQRALTITMGNMLDARFAVIEDRLLPAPVCRPPLATDKKKTVTPPIVEATKATMVSSDTVASAPSEGPSHRMAQKKSAKSTPEPTTKSRKGKTPPSLAKQTDEQPPSAPVADPEEVWVEVGRGGKLKRKTSKNTPTYATKADTSSSKPAPKPAPKTKAPFKPKLSPPRSAAVVISLDPEAEKRGVTYASIITAADERVNLGKVGISPGALKIRASATGARLLEIRGEGKVEAADKLAESLRIALDGLAKVSRPVKHADVRITGLDESVTSEKVAVAIARTGGCPESQIKVLNIKWGRRASGSVIVECPITAATALLKEGRLLVGWSSAKVEALEQRPLRCFRCMGPGHTSAMCPSDKCRDNLCFRCGKEDHKAADCDGAVRCALCDDAGKPADHYMGGRSCRAPSVRGKVAPRTHATAVREEGRTGRQEEATQMLE